MNCINHNVIELCNHQRSNDMCNCMASTNYFSDTLTLSEVSLGKLYSGLRLLFLVA